MPALLPPPLRRLADGLFAACLAAAPGLATAAVPDAGVAQVQDQIEALLREHAASLPGTLTLQIDTQGLERQTACDSAQASLPPGLRLRSRVSVTVRCDAPQRWQTFVPVQVSLRGQYPVAARTIEQGQRISPDALEPREGDLLALPGGVVLQMEAALGQLATRRIVAGQLLRDNALRDPSTILRGQTVRIMVRGSGFVASGEGEALDTAAPGGRLQVRTASGQVVSGIVQPDGTVEIAM